MNLVGIGARCIEGDADVLVERVLAQAFDAFVRGGDPVLACHGEALRFLVDAYYDGQVHVLRVLDHLHHQVGADVARTDDSGPYESHCHHPYTKFATQVPNGPSALLKVISKRSPFTALARGTRLPERIT